MIQINEEKKEFHLQTNKASYIFHVLPNEHLGHLYYGKRITHRDSFSHMYQERHRSNTAYVYEGNEAFSLDLVKQEYPVYGTTDFREPAIHVLQESGSRISDFRYAGYKVYESKRKLAGLPATYTETGDDASSIDIYLEDEVTGLQLILTYSVFDSFDAITRSVKVTNRGEEAIRLDRVLSANVDFFDADYEMLQLSGAWSRERHVETRPLRPGIQSITSTRGQSSAQQNPFLALKRPGTNEQQGDVYGFSFVYSGNFLAQVEVDQYDVSRVSMGIHPFDFSWKLEAGEAFQAPEVVMVYSDEGLNGMSQTFHRFYEKRLAGGTWRDRERPVLLNNWEGTYFDFNEEKILDIARQSKAVGVELFVLDDGWFGKRDDDTTSLGDWFTDEEKLPNGITGLAKKVNDMGLSFGLWFEPEMVSKKSKLYEEHPDWLIGTKGRKSSHGRNQYVLDFSRQEVVDNLYHQMSAILESADISYVKWDMNRPMTEIGSLDLPADRQQETAHRYILGVYELYERLTTNFPDVLFESCASGGARFDPGLLYYAPQTWTSDDTDAVERLKIQYGTSMVYPLSSMGAHVSEVPNHQVGRHTDLETRANVAFFGMFGYELDITKATEEEKASMKRQIAFYKEKRSLVQHGTFHRLKSPFEGNVTSWMVVSRDKEEALVGRYQVLSRPNVGYERLIVQGLEPTYEYRIEGVEDTFYGDELMHAGLPVDIIPLEERNKDFSSQLFVLKKV